MQLVEVVPALQTDPALPGIIATQVRQWGKHPVIAQDTPGFVVNRLARPYYGEAIRILEEGIADVATIDWAMTQHAGFRMGPFELMDLIGHDVNYRVTESVWASFYYDPRYRPSLTQKRLMEAGFYGRKTGRGFYNYAEGVQKPQPKQNEALARRITQRILAMLVNEAYDALYLKLATADDLDMAMTRGVNYPKGLLLWGRELGLKKVVSQLDELHQYYGDDRYRVSPGLRQAIV